MPSQYIAPSRIIGLSPSVTLSLDARVKSMISQGADVINLTVGEPNFDTPIHIREAALEAMNKGYTHYTATAGISQLREAISQKFLIENSIAYQPSQIIVGVGSKQLLFHAFMSLLEVGEEVIVPVPTWGSYIEQIKLAGGKAITVSLRSPFKLTCAHIESSISPKTKIVLLNSPSNPTGAVIDLKEIEKIAKLVVKHNLWVVSDEIYEKLIYGQNHISIASLSSDITARTITINGFSKAYAMTGWRIGYAGGPIEVIQAMEALQSQTTSNTSSIAQYAGLAALQGDQTDLQNMKKSFEKQRSLVIKRLSSISALQFIQPEGAFYFFINVQSQLGKSTRTSTEWCEQLLEKTKVAVVPGEAFFYPGYVRLSFANSIENLEKGLSRIKQFIKD